MKLPLSFKKMVTVLVLLFVGMACAAEKRLHFESGVGFRNQTPLVIMGGVSYGELTFRLQGLGKHNAPRDFWCGMRGSFLWTFFNELPFNVSLGLGAGYEYAQAPNDLHKAINQANQALYLYPYNQKEILDVSGEIWANIYGFYTQISIPVYKIMEHDAPRILWGAGYIVKF